MQSAHTRVLYILGFAGKMLRAEPSNWINGAYRYVDAESWLPGGLGDLDPRQAAAELGRPLVAAVRAGDDGRPAVVDGLDDEQDEAGAGRLWGGAG